MQPKRVGILLCLFLGAAVACSTSDETATHPDASTDAAAVTDSVSDFALDKLVSADASDAASKADVMSDGAGGSTFSSRPKGIYVLDNANSKNGAPRDANVKNTDHPFVTGYTWRMSWSDFESTKGVYDFSAIDKLIAELPAGKRLTLLMGGNHAMEPSYVATEASATYTTTSPAGVVETRAVPWDSNLATRFDEFAKALGDHGLPDPAAQGTPVALRQHSVLANICFGVPGLGEIRDRDIAVMDIPGYSRDNLIGAVTTSLKTATTQFESKVVYVPMWPIKDKTSSPTELWVDILSAITTTFDGVNRPLIGLFQENLAASKSGGIVTGYPSTKEAAPLFQGKGKTYALFQALEGWDSPFADAAKVAGATPADGLAYARDTFDSDYAELYVPDIEDQTYWPSYDAFNQSVGL